MTVSIPFRPICRTDGYLPIEDYGLIGDGATAALVGRDGAISWLCLPRFDSPPIFCGLLDAGKGGSFLIAPEDLAESRQYYEADSAVLVTEMRGPTGLVRVTDALTLRSGADLTEAVPAGRRELLRTVEVLQGSVQLRINIEPRGCDEVEAEPRSGGLRMHCSTSPNLDLQVMASFPLTGLRMTLPLEAGARVHIALQWGRRTHRHQPISPEDILAATRDSWRRWLRTFAYEGPQYDLVRRSAITLKLLDHVENGALIAAPTSSLPEVIGGVRNWDYRYTWVRDAAFSVYALRSIGLVSESAAYLAWVLDLAERGGHPMVLYNLDGGQPPAEHSDPDLVGYRGSAPVRWGNGAAVQIQNDVYGEIVDCAYLWSRGNGVVDTRLWARLRVLVESARELWRTPDQGIWEVRTPGRVFTYSAAMCHVALDRGARMAEKFGSAADAATWHAEAATIRAAILDEAWDPIRGTLVEHLGEGGLDASLLVLPLRRVIPADHPRMVATTRAIVETLTAGKDLLFRYKPAVSPDGLPGHEGAFLLCSFWLVDNLALQGRLDEALELYDRLCSRAGPLGLLPEQIDPSTDAYLGNYPQAFSHVGVISSGFNLGRLMRKREG